MEWYGGMVRERRRKREGDKISMIFYREELKRRREKEKKEGSKSTVLEVVMSFRA